MVNCLNKLLFVRNGHLLSASMKKLLGMLFQFVWNVEITKMPFQLKNFFIWLKASQLSDRLARAAIENGLFRKCSAIS